MEFKDKLDSIWNRISDKEFLANKGVANEVRYYIFDYDASDELIVRNKIAALKKQNNSDADGFQIVEYDLYKIKTFTFSGTTGIENIENNTSIIAEGDKIIIEGANANVKIFSVDGKTATLKTTSLSNSTIIDISSLGKGVYIIKANDKTLKISKK